MQCGIQKGVPILQWRYCHEILVCGRSWGALTSTWPKILRWPRKRGWCFLWATSPCRSKSPWNGILSTLEATLLQMFVVLFVARSFLFRKRAFEAFKTYQLKQHVIIHTKEKPYNCEICQCKLRLKYHIHRHA